MEKKTLAKRKKMRLKDWDYNSDGMYFITICTVGKKHILSKIRVGGGVLDAPNAGTAFLLAPRVRRRPSSNSGILILCSFIYKETHKPPD